MERPVDQNTKSIVIVGGGFAGIAAARHLKKNQKLLASHGYRVRLIDKNNYQLFYPSLYEVATKEAPSSSICLPFRQILGQKFDYIIDEVKSVDPATRTIAFADSKHDINYDFLVMATGSKTNYFNIPGMQENAISFKSLVDAKTVNDEIDTKFAHRQQADKIWVIVGGGGFSGTELAAELMRFRSRLAAKYGASPEKIEVLLIEAGDRLLGGLRKEESEKALKRLETLGVKVYLESPIAKVSKGTVELANQDKFSYDVLIWTGGVSANPLKSTKPWPTDKHGLLQTDNFLRVKQFPEIYAIGDLASTHDSAENQLPGVAEVAEKAGKQAAQNIIRSITRQDLVPYKISWTGYIVPLSGKYSILRLWGKPLSGHFAWCMQQVIFLWYLVKVLPLRGAYMRWQRFEESLFSKEMTKD